MIRALLFFIVGFIISFLVTPWVIRLSLKGGIGLDKADETRKRQEEAIPRLGGMPILLAISVGLLAIFAIAPGQSGEWFPILLGSVLMFGLGLWDDLKPLKARVKLIGQIGIASLVYSLGLNVQRVSYPGGAWSVELGPLSFIVTVFWLIAVPNIINLIDGFDGLASGLGLFMSVTLGIVGIMAEQLPVAWFAFTMAGALLGFLCFNFPPAKIYLGDGGAYLIGFCIAALSLTSSHKGSIAAVLLVTVVALGLPILDTTFAVLRRALRGFPLFHADDEHIHHRLQDLGFSKRRIILGIYGICVVLSLVALSIIWSQGRTIPIAIAVVFLLAMGAMRFLGYFKTWSEMRTQMERTYSRRRSVRYALLQAEVMELEVERCATEEEFWYIFDHTMRRIGFVKPDGADPEGFIQINVKYNGSDPWVLLAPSREGTSAEWQRIAECFRPVFVKAVEKWKAN